MTQNEIQRQIEIIRQASAEARKSKESARQFPVDAGIIKNEKKTQEAPKKNKTVVAYHQPFQITGFHSCDRELGMRLLNGSDDLRPSDNPWEWLGPGQN